MQKAKGWTWDIKNPTALETCSCCSRVRESTTNCLNEALVGGPADFQVDEKLRRKTIAAICRRLQKNFRSKTKKMNWLQAHLKSPWQVKTCDWESKNLGCSQVADYPQKRWHECIWMGHSSGLQVGFCGLSCIVVWIEYGLKKRVSCGEVNHFCDVLN